MILDFIDTSAFLKLFVAEQGSAEMIAFMAAGKGHVRIASALLPLELCSAVCRLRKGNRLNADEALSALDDIKAETRNLDIQPLTPAVFEAAIILAQRYNLRALDALHLGSAIIARDRFEPQRMRFIASDFELLKAAETEDFTIWNPVEQA